ncbi:hypothetical protein LWI29_025454 [Acer saccharum]|uniref:Protein kinase domain-containing protein n=1 Tax=Acer saccharum TaxID=4024 RepID=A0AA39RT43_ACESA|nr:hypothetical protein LWI29_025454 [Acer saccharum]
MTALTSLSITNHTSTRPEQDPETKRIGGVDEIDSMESLQFNFSTIKAATNDFPDDNKLGQGGFGAVYKGRLPNGQDIAVKRLSTNSRQGDLEFKNEVPLVAKLQHRNLVRLLGFCLEGRERLLIYEFVPNSSLDNFIFRPAGVPSCSLNITQMAISGEPVEKLFLWGHSACTLGNADHDYKVLIFGGFGVWEDIHVEMTLYCWIHYEEH